jgi:3-hydroxybutyryl-CoA dehydrogenase
MANDAVLPRFAAVGAGRMGRGIAIAFAYAGRRISLIDLRPRDGDAWQRLRDEPGRRSKPASRAWRSSASSSLRRSRALPRASISSTRPMHPARLAAAELVFEGVPETMEAKREAFEHINRHCRDDAILTSTTSSILVTQLAAIVRLPERFLNMHWLNPAYVIPVVELSCHPGTDAAVLARTKALMEEIGKLPVVCGASPAISCRGCRRW